VSQQLNAYQETTLVSEMKRRNRPVRAILNGTASIRNIIENKNGESEPSITEYILREENESNKVYKNRIIRTYVTPFLKNAVSSAAGQIFKNPITIKNKESFPDRLLSVMDNCDLVGSDLNEWLMRATEESLAYGMAIAFVDFNNPTGSERLSDQIETARPFLKMVSYFDLLGYKFDESGNITMLRFREEASIEDDFIGSDRVEQVRVVYPTRYEIYRKDEKGNDSLYDSGNIIRYDENQDRIIDRIPVSVMYGRKLGVLNAASVFEDLAYINLQHTQVDSDLSWASHFYLIPFLITIAGEQAIASEMPKISALASYINVELPYGSEIKWVETNGNAQKAGAEKLASIEKRAEASKMDSSVSVTAGARETATGRAVQADSSSAKLKLHAEAVESFAKSIIEMFASYMPEVMLPEFTVEANKDFSISLGDRTVSDLSSMNEKGQLSLSTMLSEIKRRGELADDVDVIEEIERIRDELDERGLTV